METFCKYRKWPQIISDVDHKDRKHQFKQFKAFLLNKAMFYSIWMQYNSYSFNYLSELLIKSRDNWDDPTAGRTNQIIRNNALFQKSIWSAALKQMKQHYKHITEMNNYIRAERTQPPSTHTHRTIMRALSHSGHFSNTKPNTMNLRAVENYTLILQRKQLIYWCSNTETWLFTVQNESINKEKNN